MNSDVFLYQMKFISLLLFSLTFILLVCACQALGKPAAQFNYMVLVGYPIDYGMVYERDNSYLMDENGRPILSFGGGIAAKAHWGGGSQNTLFSGVYSAPAAIKIRWFSREENQFWEAEGPLPKDQIEKMFAERYSDLFTQSTGEYTNLAVNTAPGGLASVWIGGGRQQKQLITLQAKKIDMPWDEFDKRTLGYRVSRAKFIQRPENELMAEKKRVKANYGELLAGINRWDIFQRAIYYKISVSDNYVLKNYFTLYMNGERYYTYLGEIEKITERAMPYEIHLYIEKEGVLKRLVCRYEQSEIASVFQRVLADRNNNINDPINIHLEIADNLESIDTYLIYQKNKYKVAMKSASLVDLYN